MAIMEKLCGECEHTFGLYMFKDDQEVYHEKCHGCRNKKKCSRCRTIFQLGMFLWNIKGTDIVREHKTCRKCRRNMCEFYAKRHPPKPKSPRPSKIIVADNNKQCSTCKHYRDADDFERRRSKMGNPYEHKTCNFCYQKYRRNYLKSE